jgi:saccharopine dehydrogenase-like NADP-dependent oxidoreductase
LTRALKSDKITTIKVDAGRVEDIERAAEGVDVVINLVVTWFCSNIMRAALKSGAHYVDTCFSESILSQMMENRPLEFDDEFKEAGLTALIGCGGAPGISNVLARYICDKLDRVDYVLELVINP